MKKNFFVGILIVGMCFALTGCKSSDYNSAVTAAQADNYLEAISLFNSLGDYKDSKEQLLSVINEYAESLIKKDKFDDVIDLYTQYSSVSDFSAKLDEIKSEKEKYDIYAEAKSLFGSNKIDAGFEKLATLPEEYRNVKKITQSYADLKDTPFKGSHRNGSAGDVSQKIQFTLEFSSYDECFQLHAYKAVYWSDGSVYKDYDYYLDASDIKGDTIKVGKFTWVVNSNGSITETEKGETYKYN